MFRKPVHIKNSTNLRSSDLRKLKAEVGELFGATPEDLNVLFPFGLPVTKATLGQVEGTLYSVNGSPMFVRVECEGQSVLVPSLYAVFAVTSLVPSVITHSSVVPRLVGGADLMRPGVFGLVDAATSTSTKNTKQTTPFEKGAVVQVVAKDAASPRILPVAVGVSRVDSAALEKRSAEKGVAVQLVTALDDHLFLLGDGVVPSTAGLTSVEDVEASVEDVDIDASIIQRIDDLELDDFVVVSPTSTSTDDFDMMASVTENIDNISLSQIGENDAESLVKPLGPSSTEIDSLLHLSLLKAIKFSLPSDSKSYPLAATTLYSQHMLPLLPPEADMKQSSYKKLAKFLKAMEKRGLVKSKERQQGGELVVTAIYPNHPEVTGLEIDEKSFKRELKKTLSVREGDQENLLDSLSSSTNTVKQKEPTGIQITELFKSNAAFAKMWAEIGIDKDTTFTRASLKSATETYITSQNLINPTNQRLIKIDAHLADTILSKDEHATVTHLPRDAIFTRITEKMTPWYTLTTPGNDPITKKGALKPLQLVIEKRAGRKLVTRVLGCESFLIDPEVLAAELRVPCAASTSCSVLGGGGVSGKPVVTEVMVQGDKVSEVCGWLRDHYGFVFTGGASGSGKGKGLLGVKGGGQCKWVEVVDKS